MKCPMCPGHLQRIVYEGVELDRCRLCFGLWFDKGELERFSQDDPAFALSSGRTPADRHTTLRCPKCGGFLTEGSYAPGVFFRVERCDRCHGVWLDAERVAHVRGLAEAEVRPQHPAGPVDSKTVDPATSQEIEIERQEASKQVSVGEWLFLFLTRLPREVYNPVNHFPTVTVVLIAINVIAFVLEVAALTGSNAQEVILRYAFVPDHFRQMQQPWTIVTSMFLHGGLLHLLGNMYFLYTFGDNVEDYLGAVRFLVCYLICGGIASLTAFAANTHSTVPTLGASGAIAGVLGAYIFLFPHRKIYFMIIVWPLRLAAVWYLGGWIAWQILAAAASTAGTGGVAWLAHVGGFFTGLALVVSYQALKRPDVALRFA